MTVIGDKKLTKAADNLFTEPYKNGKDFKWYRMPERLDMDVYGINVRHVSSVDDPRFPLGSEEYKEARIEYLQGVGVFDNRSIHLIDGDGKIGPSIDRMEFSIRSLQQEPGEEMRHGSMWWQDAESVRWQGRRDEHLFMEIYVSSKVFAGMVADIEKRAYESIELSIYVECFQSEVERSLAEPYMHQDYCIEKAGMARTYFQMLSVKNRSPSPHGKSLPTDDMADEDEYEENDWGDPPQDPVVEFRNLAMSYIEMAGLQVRQSRGVKIALWCIFVVLVLILFAVAN